MIWHSSLIRYAHETSHLLQWYYSGSPLSRMSIQDYVLIYIGKNIVLHEFELGIGIRLSYDCLSWYDAGSNENVFFQRKIINLNCHFQGTIVTLLRTLEKLQFTIKKKILYAYVNIIFRTKISNFEQIPKIKLSRNFYPKIDFCFIFNLKFSSWVTNE